MDHRRMEGRFIDERGRHVGCILHARLRGFKIVFTRNDRRNRYEMAEKRSFVVLNLLLLSYHYASSAPTDNINEVHYETDADVGDVPVECQDDLVIYDERQNGTENYRINIDGVIVFIAPADALDIDIDEDSIGISPAGGGTDGGDNNITEPVDPVFEEDFPYPIYVSKPSGPPPENNNPSTAKPGETVIDTNKHSVEDGSKKKRPSLHIAQLLLPLVRRGVGVRRHHDQRRQHQHHHQHLVRVQNGTSKPV